MPSTASNVAKIPATIVISFFGTFWNTTENPSEAEYKLFVFVVHWARVKTIMAGSPSPSAMKIFVRSSVSIIRDRKIATIVMKLLPTKKPIKAAVIACLGVRAQRAISGESTVPTIKIPITSEIAVPIGIAAPLIGSHTAEAPLVWNAE
ncbi:hypothetical protein D3C71_1602680 [compost metagenome]